MNHYFLWFVTLILDNEVTVGHFVTDPPLPWTRVAQQDGPYQVPQSLRVPLTAEQTKIEMKIWDEVSMEGIIVALKDLGDSVNHVLIGNNAGQGLPLAEGLPQNLIPHASIIYGANLPEKEIYQRLGYVLIGNNAGQGLPLAEGLPQNLIPHASIIYGANLPEKEIYQRLGYGSFYPRAKAVTSLLELAKNKGQPLSLVFINTIQHNEFNYHDP